MSEIIYFLIFSVIILAVIFISKIKRNKAPKPTIHSQTESKNVSDSEDFPNNILENMKNNTKTDDSIIDVTGNSYQINEKPKSKVPYWKPSYIYSYSDIADATDEQKDFYAFFKQQFRAGNYLDLEENWNYAFILLFDLLNEYEVHKQIGNLKVDLDNLAKYYPKTAKYTVRFFNEKRTEFIKPKISQEKPSFSEIINEIKSVETVKVVRLGDKFKTKLNLDDNEVKFLNKIYHQNTFFDIEFCQHQVLKLFFATIRELKEVYISENTTLNQEFGFIADLIAKKIHNFRRNSVNYQNSVKDSLQEFYFSIFKHCENAVRQFYNYERKINTKISDANDEIVEFFDIKITSKIEQIIPSIISEKVETPDENTEILLYSWDVSRWKIKFKELTQNFKNHKDFLNEILLLGKLNKKNASIENIYFDAAKFIAKFDRESALILYVYYLQSDMQSKTFNNKFFPKTIQKILFQNSEQLEDFETIITKFIKNKNLENTLTEISTLFEVKRKKITINHHEVAETMKQHSETVELLNQYLQDEEEITQNIAKKEIPSASKSLLSDTQKKILHIFAENHFEVSENVVDNFAKANNIFKNSLIESINDICFEKLDDNLIENNDSVYSINPDYYEKVMSLC